MANTITASNGYKMRPIKESDYTFVMETLKSLLACSPLSRA